MTNFEFISLFRLSSNFDEGSSPFDRSVLNHSDVAYAPYSITCQSYRLGQGIQVPQDGLLDSDIVKETGDERLEIMQNFAIQWSLRMSAPLSLNPAISITKH